MLEKDDWRFENTSHSSSALAKAFIYSYTPDVVDFIHYVQVVSKTHPVPISN
jgi:hypothetical protein